MTLATFTHGAPAIELGDLIAEAGMLTRVDRKYLLRLSELDQLTDALTGTVSVLDIDGKRAFAYRSTYFDTPEMTAFTTAGLKRRRRFKIRTRDYLDSGTSWLEVKTRGPRRTTVKTRIAHTAGPQVITSEGHDFIAAELAARFITGVDPRRLRPALETRYDRTTLHVPATFDRPATRATIDTGLTWTELAGDVTGERDDLAIVETKGVAAPSVVDKTLWRLGHRPQSVSKYGAGLVWLRPDLPALKWNRLVTTQLGVLAA